MTLAENITTQYQLLTQIAGHMAMEPFLLSTHAKLRTGEMFRTFDYSIHSKVKKAKDKLQSALSYECHSTTNGGPPCHMPREKENLKV